MGITELKKRLYNNPEKIIELLEYYRFYSIHKGNKEIRCFPVKTIWPEL